MKNRLIVLSPPSSCTQTQITIQHHVSSTETAKNVENNAMNQHGEVLAIHESVAMDVFRAFCYACSIWREIFYVIEFY